ncbi:hypothetical protein [Algoriphagus sediminis]|uniref:Riboflavin synthase subunit beta n=1 Tax=Algoriphagus sediminis TaxID=3057113 RepID=A0ABT7Y7Q3_9BACT|nr:hypothetical protein [Algoriphagus sediminis]MDN3202551.1 hypothetical protein [Algoriphagus sediminis]
MTGGAGFSKAASDSFRENRNLGKIRQKGTGNSANARENATNPSDLAENIEILNKKRDQERRIRWLIPLIFMIVFVLVMILATF